MQARVLRLIDKNTLSYPRSGDPTSDTLDHASAVTVGNNRPIIEQVGETAGTLFDIRRIHPSRMQLDQDLARPWFRSGPLTHLKHLICRAELHERDRFHCITLLSNWVTVFTKRSWATAAIMTGVSGTAPSQKPLLSPTQQCKTHPSQLGI